MYRTAQSPQQTAYVRSLIGLAYGQRQNWFLLGEDDPQHVHATNTRTERVQPLSFAGSPISAYSVFSDEATFDALARQWRKECGVTSSPVQMAMCPSYQSIMTMSDRALPLILRQLESEGDDPDHWFWALHHITHADPVKPEDRGNMIRMAAAWLDWGRRHGIAW